MTGYYAQRLSGTRLRRCYELAPPRVARYLEAEIQHVISRLREGDDVLELGCGYGRVARRLAEIAGRVVGVDTAVESLALAREIDRDRRCEYLEMDAADLDVPDEAFDAVVCIQNGVSAFNLEPTRLLREALRVTRRGGIVLLSTYADAFWPDRLAWFRAQAKEGLLGPIDEARTGDGVIVCTDGFRAGRLTPQEFGDLCATVGVEGAVTAVDGSAVFCEITKRGC